MATNREKIKESIEKWKSIVDELLTEFINGEFFEWEIDEVHSYDSISRLFNDTKDDALDYLDDCISDADLDNKTTGKVVSIFVDLSEAISTINNLKAMLNYLPEEPLKDARNTLTSKILKKDIRELESLPGATYGCLKDLGIQTIGELVSFSEEEIKERLGNRQYKTKAFFIRSIEDSLAKLGLSLKDESCSSEEEKENPDKQEGKQ